VKGIKVSIGSSKGELGSILKGSFGIGSGFLYATRSSMLNVVSCINPLQHFEWPCTTCMQCSICLKETAWVYLYHNNLL